jgi:hypothetical protein
MKDNAMKDNAARQTQQDNAMKDNAMKDNAARQAQQEVMESKKAGAFIDPNKEVRDPFSGNVLGYKSVGAKSEKAVDTTSIRPDIGESEAYKYVLSNGEFGIQRPFGVHTSGPDFITAKRKDDGNIIIVVTDILTTSKGGTKVNTADLKWAKEVEEAINNVDLDDKLLVRQIQEAFKNREVYLRQMTVDYSTAYTGKLSILGKDNLVKANY